jgi:quercetin dioxygenase-like cupin family protein
MPDLRQLARQHLEAARSSEHGRSADRILHDGHLRQSVIALVAGTELSEHNSPQAGSIHVLEGALRVTGLEPTEVTAGELVLLTHRRHAVTALADTVFLLTTVTGLEDEEAHGDPV